MANIQIDKDGLEGIEFFGKVDKKVDPETGEKRVTSDYPAWYFGPQNMKIEDDIGKLERGLKNDEISEKGRPAARKELEILRAKRDEINKSRPQYTSKQMDTVASITNDLGNEIRESMYSRSDEARGLVNAHRELDRQMTPCIPIKGDAITVARKLGCRISNDGKVSGNDANRIWKILRASMNEDSNVEILRRA
jgi:hypothetical protein